VLLTTGTWWNYEYRAVYSSKNGTHHVTIKTR
jgi:hypothetical protein